MITGLLIERLLATASVTALVGQRIRPGRFDQKDELPAIRVVAISETRNPNHQHASGVVMARVQVDAVGRSAKQAGDVIEACRLSLDGYDGCFGTTEVKVFLADRGESHEPPKDAGDIARFISRADFEIHYYESIPTFG